MKIEIKQSGLYLTEVQNDSWLLRELHERFPLVQVKNNIVVAALVTRRYDFYEDIPTPEGKRMSWPKKYSEINHPWPHYCCPSCGKELQDDDMVRLIAAAGQMQIIHEKDCLDTGE